MNQEEKSIATILIICVIICGGAIGYGFLAKASEDRAWDAAWESWQMESQMRISLDSVMHAKRAAVPVWKNFDKWEYAELYKIEDRYLLITNLNVNKDIFYRVLDICEKAGVDIFFVMNVLWRESRIGANIKHKTNYDGSIDGGWFGLNSKYHPLKTLGDPLKDVYKFIDYFDQYCRPYPEYEWFYRYTYGDKKARELGFIK